MKNEKKSVCLNIPVERFDRLKETAGRLSMTMTALLNRLVKDYLDSDAGEMTLAKQAEKITSLECKIVDLQRALNELLERNAA